MILCTSLWVYQQQEIPRFKARLTSNKKGLQKNNMESETEILEVLVSNLLR